MATESLLGHRILHAINLLVGRREGTSAKWYEIILDCFVTKPAVGEMGKCHSLKSKRIGASNDKRTGRLSWCVFDHRLWCFLIQLCRSGGCSRMGPGRWEMIRINCDHRRSRIGINRSHCDEPGTVYGAGLTVCDFGTVSQNRMQRIRSSR